jgi:DNA-binding NtrC family response regulator
MSVCRYAASKYASRSGDREHSGSRIRLRRNSRDYRPKDNDMPKVLIVDDEPQYGAYLRDWLSREGHEVKAVTTAEDAIDFGAHWRPSVLVADWMLSSPLDGLQVSEAVRAVNPNLRTILITGYPSRELRARAEQANVFSFIEKPFSLTEVAGAVRQAANVSPGLLPGRVLIVSQSPTVTELARESLQAANCASHTAATADDARRILLADADIRIAILDCIAPSIDLGILAAELRELRHNLIVVGSSEADDQRQFAALGIEHFLPRFWDASDLYSQLIRRINVCGQCGLALPLRHPLAGDGVRKWECATCGARYRAVVAEDATDEVRRNVRPIE